MSLWLRRDDRQMAVVVTAIPAGADRYTQEVHHVLDNHLGNLQVREQQDKREN